MIRHALMDKVRGCFVGVAIGDALGMPVEMMTHEEIMAATDGAGITDFIDPIQTKIKGTRAHRAGWTTDDTQLTLAVARSLIRCRGFFIEDQAKTLVEEWGVTKFGWGRASKKAAEELGEWFKTGGKKGRAPDLRVPPPENPGESCGNGVAMKIAPIPIFYALSGCESVLPVMDAVMELGFMTHGDPRASFAAAAVAEIVFRVMHSNTAAESQFMAPLLIERLTETIAMLEKTYRYSRIHKPAFSTRLDLALELSDSPAALRQKVGTGCFALESVPFAIGTFLRHMTDFRAGVLEAVNAGGDTDSTASMVGGMIGAHLGLSGIPEAWVNRVSSATEATRVADTLTMIACSFGQ